MSTLFAVEFDGQEHAMPEGLHRDARNIAVPPEPPDEVVDHAHSDTLKEAERRRTQTLYKTDELESRAACDERKSARTENGSMYNL
jgi:hypothetical protein